MTNLREVEAALTALIGMKQARAAARCLANACERLTQEHARLRKALEQYGRHRAGCAACPMMPRPWLSEDTDSCDCGLAAALAEEPKP